MWYDFYKLFAYAFKPDPLSLRHAQRELQGVAVTNPDAIPDIRQDGSFWGGGKGVVRLRDTNDFVDLSSVTNRQSRYKEYERLRSVAEIESALTIFSDESCISGDTIVATAFGMIPIKELAEKKKPEERFLVYCYDHKKEDYTLGWAFNPRKTKTAKTLRVYFDNGGTLDCTPDHKILLRNGSWSTAEALSFGDELMPFYRLAATGHSCCKTHQFPRIFTLTEGWKHERQFVDEWRLGRKNSVYDERVNKIIRAIMSGLTLKRITDTLEIDRETIKFLLKRNGFSYREIKYLSKRYPNQRRVIGVSECEEMDVYDMSVEDYRNFATEDTIVHNCQRGDNNHVFEIRVKSDVVKKELDFLFHKLIKIDRKIWNWAKNLYMFGDFFLEVVIDPMNPKAGILKVQPLPPDSIFRIETTKGKLLEYQQSKEGPDYQSLARVEVTKATDQDLAQATAIRFAPEQIVHIRIGDDRKTFYPYGVSLIEAARGPAHQLRLMEDAMVVYRLVRAPERRVFYIDVGQLPPNRAEAFIERMKDQFRKKKVYSNKSNQPGGSSPVEERWHAPAADEDYWIPIRPNANTRIETLPGACLALNTKIPLLDGRTLLLSEIIKEYQEGKELWAYSCNPKTGEPAPGLISWAGVTRQNTQVVKVTLDNGEIIICTPDHKFPVIGKGEIQAKDLAIGESLIPWNTRLAPLHNKHFNSNYLQVYNPAKKEWEFVHKKVCQIVKDTKYHQIMVYDEKYNDCAKGVIHHIDINKFNNSPPNLVWMNWDDHVKYHRDNQDVMNKHISQSLKKYHQNLTEEEKAKRDAILVMRAAKGHAVVLEKLKNDTTFNQQFREKQKAGWEKAKIEKTELHKRRGDKISQRNNDFWANPANKKLVFDKQTLIYPKEILNFTLSGLSNGKSAEEIATEIGSNQELVTSLFDANNHIVRGGVDFSNFSVDHVKKMLKQYGYKSVRNARENVGGKELKSGRPKKSWPKEVMDEFMNLLKHEPDVNKILSAINQKQHLLDSLKSAGIILTNGFDRNAMNKMLKEFGYKGLTQAREEAPQYNHRVVSVEWLEEKIDTGTLTIDANHTVHNYHTFAINCGVMVKNSSLGEIDDALYFRNKLYTALQLPKNYLAQEDVQQTKITLSSQDVKFARFIERLQLSLTDGFYEMADRHLTLRGFPPEMWDDLEILATPPSEWREISRQEVITSRYTNASTLKSAQLMSDYDIYVDILKIPPDVAKTYVQRNKMQKYEDMKFQVMGQNPDLMGIGAPGPDDQELGSEAGGPNPMLDGQPPSDGQQPPEGGMAGSQPPLPQGPAGATAQPEAQPLPEPTEKELKKYNLVIQDFSKEKDDEELDQSELKEE